MLSGVDDHGQLVEHELTLFAQPDVEDGDTTTIHSGTAVAVYEIRQVGPQGLRRFYRVQAVDGTNGWIAEYYVRRVAYLFAEEETAVSLFDAPDGKEITQLGNITPVTIKDPTAKAWWQVQTVAEEQVGWVQAIYIQESPEPEFLVNQQHPHEP